MIYYIDIDFMKCLLYFLWNRLGLLDKNFIVVVLILVWWFELLYNWCDINLNKWLFLLFIFNGCNLCLSFLYCNIKFWSVKEMVLKVFLNIGLGFNLIIFDNDILYLVIEYFFF